MSGVTWSQHVTGNLTRFYGTFDGAGHTIKNLTLNNKQDYVGLFAKCNGTIKNLTMENVNIEFTEGAKEYKYVGAIAGYSSQGYFENIVVKGDINVPKTSYVGGIAGYLRNSGDVEWTGLKNEANITGASYVGGIFGELQGWNGNSYSASYTGSYDINNIENTGTITGTGDYVGGIFGYIYCSTLVIKNVSNYSNIIGRKNVGGISGYLRCSTTSEAYNLVSNGSVSGNEKYGTYFGEGTITFK